MLRIRVELSPKCDIHVTLRGSGNIMERIQELEDGEK